MKPYPWRDFSPKEQEGGYRISLVIEPITEKGAATLYLIVFIDLGREPPSDSQDAAKFQLDAVPGLRELVQLIRREIQRRRCSILVLDGLVSAQASAASDQEYKEFVHALQEIALATDCTMFLLTNTSREVSPDQTMVDGLIELTDISYGSRSESALRVSKFRGSDFLRGHHAYKITDAGIVVYPRIETRLARPSVPDENQGGLTSSGIVKLDQLLGGGLPAASTTMLMGPSGIGKTTLGLQFLATSSETEPGLLFGFYETPARIRAKADQNCRLLGPLIDSGVVELLWQPPTDEMFDACGERLLDAVHKRKVRRLFIDGFNGLMKTAVEPDRMDHFFAAIANELRAYGVTTVYTIEVPDILGPAIRVPINNVSNLAENMILMRYIELRSKLHRLISILKIRSNNFEPSLYEFAITDTGIEIQDTSQSAESIMSNLGSSAANIGVTGSNTQTMTSGG